MHCEDVEISTLVSQQNGRVIFYSNAEELVSNIESLHRFASYLTITKYCKDVWVTTSKKISLSKGGPITYDDVVNVIYKQANENCAMLVKTLRSKEVTLAEVDRIFHGKFITQEDLEKEFQKLYEVTGNSHRDKIRSLVQDIFKYWDLCKYPEHAKRFMDLCKNYGISGNFDTLYTLSDFKVTVHSVLIK